MSALWPTPAEISTLRFAFPGPGFGGRLLLAAAAFALGLTLWCLAPLLIAIPGLLLVLLGHLPLWVRRQTIAPGGATPQHEEVWVPVEDGWLDRVEALEQRGRRWDATPWEFTNAIGCLTLFGILGVVGVVVALAGFLFGLGLLLRLAVAVPLLVVPLWFNGIRTIWHPSELRTKGIALAMARQAAEAAGGGDFEPVPLLALREGKRGRYPVDARLMLRPAREDDSGFLGVQVQVSINNVQGTDYPYLYAVILGRGGFVLPRPESLAGGTRKHPFIAEPGESGGVRYLVVRQHADDKGGWRTEPLQIAGIVEVALRLGRDAWAASGGRAEA